VFNKINSIRNIFLFFITLIVQIIIISLILFFSFNLSIDNIINDKIEQNVKSIYFIFLYLLILINLYFFSSDTYLRIYKSEEKIKHIILGFSIGTISIILYYYVLTIFDFFSLDLSRFNLLLVFYSLILSFFISFIEELVFRDYIFNKFTKKYGIEKSVIYSSYIYAQLHFLKFNLSFIEILIPILSLFFFGVILSKFYIKKGIFFTIGIHWAYIFFISYINQTWIIKPISNNFFTGALYPPNGLLACIILFLFFYKHIKKAPY
jgi:membrane protease YdiL (CAAX protease family)